MSRLRAQISQCSGRTSLVHFLRFSPLPLFLDRLPSYTMYIILSSVLRLHFQDFHSAVHSSCSPFPVYTGKLFKSKPYCKRHYSFYISRPIFKDFSILKTTFFNTEYIYAVHILQRREIWNI